MFDPNDIIIYDWSSSIDFDSWLDYLFTFIRAASDTGLVLLAFLVCLQVVITLTEYFTGIISDLMDSIKSKKAKLTDDDEEKTVLTENNNIK